MKEQGKTSEKDLNEVEISDLPDKEFKIMVIKMLIELRRRMDEQSKNFNKGIESVRKYQIEVAELKSIVSELKNTIEGFNSALHDTGERISLHEDRAVEII